MAMRRKDGWASLVPPGLMGPGAGPMGDTAYDQTAPEGDPLAGAEAVPAGGAGGAQPPVQDAPTGLLAGMGGGDAGGGTTDDMTGAQLGELVGADSGMASPDEQAFQEMQSALEDPNTPPEVRQQIEQQIALAARRQMLGGA